MNMKFPYKLSGYTVFESISSIYKKCSEVLDTNKQRTYVF